MADAPTGVAGTLPYMSPEQLLGEEVDHRSDIYSAGVVLFELATQRLPFTDSLVPETHERDSAPGAAAPRRLAPKLSPDFERIVLKCLEKDPELRYQSAKELATDLRRLEVTSSTVTVAATLPKLPGVALRADRCCRGLRLDHRSLRCSWPRFTGSGSDKRPHCGGSNSPTLMMPPKFPRYRGMASSWRFCAVRWLRKFRKRGPSLVQVFAGRRTRSTHK